MVSLSTYIVDLYRLYLNEVASTARKKMEPKKPRSSKVSVKILSESKTYRVISSYLGNLLIHFGQYILFIRLLSDYTSRGYDFFSAMLA